MVHDRLILDRRRLQIFSKSTDCHRFHCSTIKMAPRLARAIPRFMEISGGHTIPFEYIHRNRKQKHLLRIFTIVNIRAFFHRSGLKSVLLRCFRYSCSHSVVLRCAAFKSIAYISIFAARDFGFRLGMEIDSRCGIDL